MVMCDACFYTHLDGHTLGLNDVIYSCLQKKKNKNVEVTVHDSHFMCVPETY